MLNGRFIKINRVIENVHRDYGFENLNWIDCIEWIGECLDLIGAPKTYVEKATDGQEKLGHPNVINIIEGRGSIPCEMFSLVQAFKRDGKNLTPMRVTTDTTMVSYQCSGSSDYNRDSEYTYKLNNGHIFTSFDDGEVVMVYMANPTDEDGYPMVPDNIKFIKACQAYVGSKMILKLQLKGKTINPRAEQKIETDLAWYTGAADSAARIPTIDEMESWKNMFLKLIPEINNHSNAFRADGQMERRFNNSTNQYLNGGNIK